MILEKSKQFAVTLNKDFNPTTGWLWRWQKREGISLKKIHGEAASADSESANNFINILFPNLIEGYKSSDIFNADESGLFFKALPVSTLSRKESHNNGFKSSKDRLTLLFICNATGDYKKISAIESGKTIGEFAKSINIFNALHIIKHAWWLVRPLSITRCFQKAKFISECDAAPSAENEQEDITEIISDLSGDEFDNYIRCDDNLVCCGQLDEEIVKEISLEKEDNEDYSDSDAEDEIPDEIPSLPNVLNSLTTVRKFLLPQNEFIQELENIEEYVYKNYLKKITQSKITDYFKETPSSE
ncbi:unnamed protein product [Hermetia illucens]|uniref:HTH CENPB-type domain-containing protein n=1 Tax=Hermetia illucens TaxID=343691 RepID=A0A7R8UMR2_HERIL|nr:unnamed protein product [Hermetia illucens]